MDPIAPALSRTEPPSDDLPRAPPPGPSNAAKVAQEAADAFDALASGEHGPLDLCIRLPNGIAHNIDRGPKEYISNATLYLKQTGNATDVALTDIQQSKIGDCALMATLAAMTTTLEGRALLRNAIVENKNDKGVVTSYTVTLHQPESHWFRRMSFKEVKVTVDCRMPCGHALPATEGKTNEIWPLVIEKAYAQFGGGYNTLNRGEHADAPMQVLTGRPAASIDLGDYSAAQLTRDLAAGKLLVFETKGGLSAKTPYLHSLHAYSVTGTDVRDGRLYVTLNNPWGSSQPDPIPYDEFAKWFSSVDIGSVR